MRKPEPVHPQVGGVLLGEFRQLRGQVDVEVVAVLCPVVLCGRWRLVVLVTGGEGLGGAAAGHIMLGLREAASSTPVNGEEVVPMLETYFVKPHMADRIRACGIGAEIECYAGWLSEQGYSSRTLRRVPVLVAFGEFARRRGASVPADLPAHVDAFVAMRVASCRRGPEAAGEIRGGIEINTKLAVLQPPNHTMFRRDPRLTQSGDQTNRCSTGSPRCDHYVVGNGTAQPLTTSDKDHQPPPAT